MHVREGSGGAEAVSPDTPDLSAEVRAQLVRRWERREGRPGRRPSLPTDEEVGAFLRHVNGALDSRGRVAVIAYGRVGTLDRRAVEREWARWWRMYGR
jgi:hypothetical protein